MRKFLGVLVGGVMVLAGLSTGCTKKTNNNSQSSGNSNGTVKVAVSLAAASDPYIGGVVGKAVKSAFENAGAQVDTLDGQNTVTTQLQQIQNAAVKGVNIIYVFPVGDAQAYGDTLRKVRQSGVKILVSNNDTGTGSYDVYVGSEEFYMGIMMAVMVSRWIDTTLPQSKTVKALILEAQLNDTSAKRCLGMRMINQKFLRKADLKSMSFIKIQGNACKYKDSTGNVQQVDEPTGGLVLDKDGYAILNPFYDPRVVLISAANRFSSGYDAVAAQKEVQNTVTNGNSDLQIVISYGAIGISVSDTMIQMSKAGTLKNNVSKLSVFCSDATPVNLDAMSRSADNSSILRGVMASGDLIGTVCDYAGKMVKGEKVPEVTQEPLSYELFDPASGKPATVYYTDLKEKLPVDINQLF